MSALTLACLVALLACVGSFVWGMGGGFFRRVDRAGWGFRAIQLGGILAFLWTLWALWHAGPISTGAGTLALAMYGLSLALFWWAVVAHARQPPTHAFSGDLPTWLVQRGPYRAIRHPFYSSYLLTWTAGLVATHQGSLAAPVVLMTIIYVVAANQEERKFLRSALSEQYQVYRARTGQFLPWC